MPHRSIACRFIVGLALAAGVAASVWAQPVGRERRADRGPSLYITNARVLSMSGPALDGATIHIGGANIRRIGTDIEIPDGATVIDAAGLTVTPGLIDVDGTLGVSYAERGGSADPTNRALDAFDRYATPLFKDAVRNGVTALAISPRTGSGVTGTGAVLRLQAGPDGPWAGVAVKEDAALCIDLGSGASPTERLEIFDRVRRQFKTALDYRESLDTYKEELEEYEKKIKERAEKEAKETKGKKPENSGEKETQAQPERPAPQGPPAPGAEPAKEAEKKDDEIKKPVEPTPDRKSEVVLKAIDRKMPVRVRCERSEDIFNALELAKEFSLDLIIDGGTEAYLVAPEIAEADAAVVLGPALGRDFFQNDAYHRRSVAGLDVLLDAGVKFAVGSGRGGGIHGAGAGLGTPSASRFVLANAQLVAQQSSGDVDPLRLVTADAADFLGVGDRIGRLRPGMAADIVLWTGDPLDPAARVREVYVGGELVYRNESAAGDGENR